MMCEERPSDCRGSAREQAAGKGFARYIIKFAGYSSIVINSRLSLPRSMASKIR